MNEQVATQITIDPEIFGKVVISDSNLKEQRGDSPIGTALWEMTQKTLDGWRQSLASHDMRGSYCKVWVEVLYPDGFVLKHRIDLYAPGDLDLQPTLIHELSRVAKFNSGERPIDMSEERFSKLKAMILTEAMILKWKAIQLRYLIGPKLEA